MNETDRQGRRWLLRLQSALVLPIARGVYLLIALTCLVVVIGGIFYVVFLQASTVGQPKLVAVPPADQAGEPLLDASDRAVDLALVQARLEPPSAVRFNVTAGTLSAPPSEGQVLGHFVAETPNGLAPFPEGVSLIGGPDAELFERVSDGAVKRVGLAARAALVTELSAMLENIGEPTSRSFTVRVVARDKYGLASAPVELSFPLRLAPAPPPASAAASAPTVEPEPTPLQAIARDIARTVEPEVNPAHFAAYKVAEQVPGRCGTDASDQRFITNYRRAFDEVRPRLTASNVDAFYLGLCEAWESVLEQEAAEAEQLEEQYWAERQAAEYAREQALARNRDLMNQHERHVLEARARTWVTLSVIGGALGIFLSVALVLAFLALEGHSRAVRAAMEAMVKLTEQGRATAATTPSHP